MYSSRRCHHVPHLRNKPVLSRKCENDQKTRQYFAEFPLRLVLLRGTEKYVDIENRAYFLTLINQRWLSIRVDTLGGLRKRSSVFSQQSQH